MNSIELLNKSNDYYSEEEYKILSIFFPGYSKIQLEEFFSIDGSLLGVHVIKQLYKIGKFDPEDLYKIFSDKKMFKKFVSGTDCRQILFILNMVSLEESTRKNLLENLGSDLDISSGNQEVELTSHELSFMYLFNSDLEISYINFESKDYKLLNGFLKIKIKNGKQLKIFLDDIITGYLGYLINYYNKKFKDKGGINLHKLRFEKILKKIIIKLLKENSIQSKYDLNSIDLNSIDITFHLVIRKKQRVQKEKSRSNSTLKKDNSPTHQTSNEFLHLGYQDMFEYDDIEEIIALFNNSKFVRDTDISEDTANSHVLSVNNVTMRNDFQKSLNTITNATMSKDKKSWDVAIKLYLKFLKYLPQHLNHRFGVYDLILKYQYNFISLLPAEILSIGSGPHEEYRAWYDIVSFLNGKHKIPRITNIDFSKVCFEESINEMSEDMRDSLNTEDIVGDMRDLGMLGSRTFDMIECSSFDNLDGEEGAIKNLIIKMLTHLKTGGILRFMLNKEFTDEFIDLLKKYGIKIYHKHDKVRTNKTKIRRNNIFNNKMGRVGYFFAVKTKDIDIQSFSNLLSQVDVFKSQTDTNHETKSIPKTNIRYTWKRLFEVKTIRKFKELVTNLKESGIIDVNKAKILIERFIDNNRVTDEFKYEVLSLLENVNGISEILNFEKRFKKAKMDYIREIVHSNKKEFLKYFVDSELLLFHEKIQIIDSFIGQIDLSGMENSVNKLLSQYNNLITYDAMYRHIHFIIYYAEKSGMRNIKLPDQLKVDMGIN